LDGCCAAGEEEGGRGVGGGWVGLVLLGRWRIERCEEETTRRGEEKQRWRNDGGGGL